MNPVERRTMKRLIELVAQLPTTMVNEHQALLTEARALLRHSRAEGPSAAEMGRVGGAVKSAVKAAAVRENGKKGGRPPKPGSRRRKANKPPAAEAFSTPV